MVVNETHPINPKSNVMGKEKERASGFRQPSTPPTDRPGIRYLKLAKTTCLCSPASEPSNLHPTVSEANSGNKPISWAGPYQLSVPTPLGATRSTPPVRRRSFLFPTGRHRPPRRSESEVPTPPALPSPPLPDPAAWHVSRASTLPALPFPVPGSQRSPLSLPPSDTLSPLVL